MNTFECIVVYVADTSKCLYLIQKSYLRRCEIIMPEFERIPYLWNIVYVFCSIEKFIWCKIGLFHCVNASSCVNDLYIDSRFYIYRKLFSRQWLQNVFFSLRWRHHGRDSVSNHQSHDCLLNRLFRRRSKKTSKLHVTGLCAGNTPEIGEFPTQMASNAKNISIWFRHHGLSNHW